MKQVGAMVQQGGACHIEGTNQVVWKPTAQNSHWHCPIPASLNENLQ